MVGTILSFQAQLCNCKHQLISIHNDRNCKKDSYQAGGNNIFEVLVKSGVQKTKENQGAFSRYERNSYLNQ